MSDIEWKVPHYMEEGEHVEEENDGLINVADFEPAPQKPKGKCPPKGPDGKFIKVEPVKRERGRPKGSLDKVQRAPRWDYIAKMKKQNKMSVLIDSDYIKILLSVAGMNLLFLLIAMLVLPWWLLHLQ